MTEDIIILEHLLRFQQRYEQSAKPFLRTFTRRDLHALLAKFGQTPHCLAA